MSVYAANRVKESATGAGLNNLALAGAFDGYRTFADAIPVGGQVYYYVIDGNAWEVGVGTLVSSSELSRDTIKDSSATSSRVNSNEAGTPVKLTLSGGSHTVVCGPGATDGLFLDLDGGVANSDWIRLSVFKPDFAAMKDMGGLTDGEGVFVFCGATAGDGKGGAFEWDEDDSALPDNVDTFRSDHYDSGLWKRRVGVIREYFDDLFEGDASSGDGARLRMFANPKASNANDYVQAFVDRADNAFRIAARWAQSSLTNLFSFYTFGDTRDCVEAHVPIVLASRTDATNFSARALAWLAGVSRLAFGSASTNWEVPLTKGGYIASAVATVSELRALDAAGLFTSGQRAWVFGDSAFGDVQPFTVEWAPASSATHDGFNVFRPSTGSASSGAGRWLRAANSISRNLSSGDATPSISNGSFFVTAGTTAITDFDDAFEGQVFTIQRGASDIQITHNASLIECGGSNLLLTAQCPRAVFSHVGGVHRLVSLSRALDDKVFTPTALTGEAIQDAIDRAVSAGGGRILCVGADYLNVGDVLIQNSNILIEGVPGKTRFIAPADSADYNMVSFIGAVGSPVDVNANASEGSCAVELTSATGFAAGDVILAETGFDADGIYSVAEYVMNRVRSVSSNVLTLEIPNVCPLAVADDATVKKVTALKNVGVRGVIFDNGSNTGETRGLKMEYIDGNLSGDNEFRGFHNHAGCHLFGGIGSHIGANRFYDSGEHYESDLYVEAHSACTFGPQLSQMSSGYGPRFIRCNNLSIDQIVSQGATSRGSLFITISYSNVRNLIVNNAGATGVSFAGYNRKLNFGSIVACSNGVRSAFANGHGIWFEGFIPDGGYTNGISIDQVVALNNYAEDIYLSDGVTNYTLRNCRYDDIHTNTNPGEVQKVEGPYTKNIGQGVFYEYEDNGATLGPYIGLIRRSASPAANDFLGALRFYGFDSAGEDAVYGDVLGYISDPTSGNENGGVIVRSQIAGGLVSQLTVGAGVMGIGATGGLKGTGTANFTAVYDDNSLLSCYIGDMLPGQEMERTALLTKWDARVPDRTLPAVTRDTVEVDEKGVRQVRTEIVQPERTVPRTHEPLRAFLAKVGTGYDPRFLDSYNKHWREKRHLTSMPNEEKFDPVKGMSSGAWIQRLIETVELQHGHDMQLYDMIVAQGVELAALRDELAALRSQQP